MRAFRLRAVAPCAIALCLLVSCRRSGAPAEVCELGDAVVGGLVEPAAADAVAAVKKKAWEAALGGEEAARPHVRARLAGWPSRLLVDPETLPSGGRELVARLARDTWRGLEALTDRESHLPIDNLRLGETSTAGAEARVGDYTGTTGIGLRLISIVAAHKLGLIDAHRAVDELRALLATLGSLERHAGFFYNYYDTTSLERTSNFVSFVDSSWLTAGLMVVRAAFPELGEACSRLIDESDYRFFYDEATGLMSHGTYVHRQARSRYHYGVLYAESRLGSLIAIGKGDVPPEHWFRMVRTFPAACAWQSQAPRARVRKQLGGVAFFGGYYEWQGARYVPSWGGSMFEALMPTLVLDEPAWAPRSLGENDRVHAEVQRRYAREELGYPVWGLSPSTRPSNGGYGEFGVKVLGSLGYAPGAVTPHASALALAVTPGAAIDNLRALASGYELYGEYGFYDAVDPGTGRAPHVYLTLDLAMTFIAAANHLEPGCIQRYFASDAVTRRVLPLLAAENFFD